MSIETLTSTILREMPDINKWQRDFFHHHMGLFLTPLYGPGIPRLPLQASEKPVKKYFSAICTPFVCKMCANKKRLTRNYPRKSLIFNVGLAGIEPATV